MATQTQRRSTDRRSPAATAAPDAAVAADDLAGSPDPARIAGATLTDYAGRWTIDADRSSLQITVKFGFLATVTGRFTDVRGTVAVGGGLVDSAIAVEVATDSLTTGSTHWDGVLSSAGLVDSAASPTIAFESTGMRAAGTGWTLAGVLVTDRGCLPVTFELECLSDQPADRMRFRATGSVATKDAVRLLSRAGVERVIGKQMAVDLLIEAVRD